MTRLPFARHLRAAAVVHPPVRRWHVALKAGLTLFVLLSGAKVLGLGSVGMLSSMGAFTVLYGPDAPGRHRLKLLVSVAVALTVSATVGALLGPFGPLWVFGLAVTGAIASFVIVALRVGAPGAFFIVLVQGVAGAAVGNGVPVPELIAAVATGAAVAAAIGMSDLLFDGTGPQRRAVEAAEWAIGAYEKAANTYLASEPPSSGASASDDLLARHRHSSPERDQVVLARHHASSALHAAWTSVTDGGDVVPWADRLWAVRDRYLMQSRRDLAAQTSFDPSPWGEVGGVEETWDGVDFDEPATVGPPSDPADVVVGEGSEVVGEPSCTDERGAEQEASPLARLSECLGARSKRARSRRLRRREERAVVAEQIKNTSLGRPDPATLLRQAARYPSEELLIASRVFVGSLCAGLLALAIGNDHVYWAVAFTSLILHQGGTRDAQIVRLLQRVIGTAVGLGLFALLTWWSPAGWALIAVVTVLQGAVELLIVRNYAVAVTLITPLALTLGELSMGAARPDLLIADRALDTVIAAVFAFAVLSLVGRGLPVPLLRAHARSVVEGVEEVLVDISAERTHTEKGREHRRQLYFSLLRSHDVAARAAADDELDAGAYHSMERTLSNLGYLVLSMTWHPDVRGAHGLAAQARGPLDAIQRHGIDDGRPAGDIHADVRALERVVKTWEPQE